MYPSTTATQASSRRGGYGKGHAPQVPKGFTVRVFKGPSAYSFPQTTPFHFDRGYQSIALTEPRQSSNQIWYPGAQNTASAPSAPSEPHKTSRPSASSGTLLSDDNRLLTYDRSSRSKLPGYSIYQSSNDNFIYEASLSTKSESDSTMTSEDTSSAFSPAMSTDSITTVRGANTPDASFTNLQLSTDPAPTSSSRMSFPLHIPGLAQAQTAIMGIFRSQTQNDSQPPADTSRAVNTSSSTSSAMASGATRSNTPFRASETTSRSGERDVSNSMRRDGPASTSENTHLSRPFSSVSDDEDNEDPIARANAEYNAASSRIPSAPYYAPVSDSMHIPAVGPVGPGAGLRQLYPNLPLHSSPEQYHAQAPTPHVDNESSYWTAAEMPRHPSVANGQQNNSYRYTLTDLQSTNTESSWSQQYVKPPRVQSGSQNHGARLPSGEHSALITHFPLSQNNSDPSGRYVPASFTMTPRSFNTSPEPMANRGRHEQNGSASVPPPPLVRELETSVSRVSPTITGPQGLVPREGGAGIDRPIASADEEQSSVARRASYAPCSVEAPAIQEPSALSTVPQQVYNAPSTHSATQTNCDAASDATYRNITSAATRPSSNHRVSPEQVYMYSSSQQPAPQPHTYTPGERASNYVSSASTRGASISPPRTRRDSLSVSASGLPIRSSAVETKTPGQGRPQQDRRTSPPLRQSSIYESQNPRFDDPYSRTTERAAPVSDTYLQRGSTSRTQYENDTRPPFDRAPTGSVPPSTVSSDASPEADHRRPSYVERAPSQYARGEGGHHGPSVRGHPETLPAHTAAVPDQTPFPAPLREPQRRYSDGDSSAMSHSTYGPAYSGANVPPVATNAATEVRRTVEPQPQRRYSDGESNVPDRTSLTLFRTVRWNENLICPSPIFAHQRRKGWFNRKGDQLWTNDGAYKPPALGQEYPPDLDGYPEHGEGWMNEQGVRIDMTHRLIPKAPLKSALKQSRPQPAAIQQNH